MSTHIATYIHTTQQHTYTSCASETMKITAALMKLYHLYCDEVIKRPCAEGAAPRSRGRVYIELLKH
eukprot:2683826-Rhodomonas_salina.1